MVDFAQFLRNGLARVCTLVAGVTMATNAAASNTDEQAVLAPLQAVFDGLAARDRSLVMQHLLPGGSVTLMRDGKPIQLSFPKFAHRITQVGTTRREERIYDALVRIDDDIAIIWAPYIVTVDGKIDHCGTDIANLVRLEGRWWIAGLADNSRRQCRPPQ